ncbi:ATP-dependent protease La [Gonapodya prolifera JEL478]|uniref:Lon protease homolog n=1 Tax=Gonapodya prolifera (strain JEL478) TaxID=1344416 RepID=A0A139AUH0_GONPJ|nr:ATP-dependent protease La [Gonapodya prolifera JEL478]|eukprot:KXS20354.1 ATP-dependent protease La [Gonapodya prolifera JEL478]
MIDDTQPPRLADMVASMIDLSIEEKLSVLDAVEPKDRIEKVLKLLARQIQVLKISRKLQTTVEGKLGEKQREAILREQMNAIKQELGEKDEDQDEIEELVKRIKDSNLPEEADKAAQREIKRLKRMHPSMAEYQVVRSYLEWLADLPWNKVSEDRLDIDSARKQLNEDHYGLEKIKTRILEFLAVRKLKKDMRGPILCFVGPPGVGKTSLGKSIAAALNRKFYRISLGGVRDEAEIRGHRRTYIGAMPGMVIQGMRRCGTANPVFLLDEIDKLGRDFRGDPSSALLEVLDPEQNSTFNDHYINVPFDLSKVFFIATANEESTIPGPLLDRMEIIRLPGYTFDEKLHIARKYLLPKQITAHGLSVEDVKMDDEVIMKIATGYTREAGVRNLEREVAGVVRGLAVEYTEGKEKGSSYEPQVSLEKLAKILGPEMFDDEVAERQQIPGVVTGLAWTAMGGGLLFIEATEMPGRGQIHLTGKLGDVIKESAQVAVAWVRAHASALGITKDGKDSLFDKADIHIHFPAGATPKDGPSAGVTIVTAVVGLLTGKAVKDHTAMTGEITLRGQVLPVGGIKEKVLAAHRGGIKNIIIPFRNRKDLVEIPENVRADINFTFAKAIEDVLRAAFDDGEEMTKILGKTRFIGNGQVEARL